jgi:hypothetical protein
VHLSIILCGIFAKRHPGPQRANTTAFWTAVILSVLWNALASWILLWMCWLDSQGGSIGYVKDYLANLPKLSSFLISGALAYFFVRQTKEDLVSPFDAEQPERLNERENALGNKGRE